MWKVQRRALVGVLVWGGLVPGVGLVAAPQAGVTIYSGQTLLVGLETPLNSRTAHPNDKVEATILPWNGRRLRAVIPQGTVLRGVVEQARPADKRSRIASRLKIAFNQVVFPDGRVIPMSGLIELDGDAVPRSESGTMVGAILGLAPKWKDIGLKKGAREEVKLEKDLTIPGPPSPKP